MYRDSRDPKKAQAEVVVRTGRKWSAQAVVLDAESRLHHKDLVGVVADGRAGLGMFPTQQRKECKGMEKGRQIQEEVRAAVEEGRSSRVAKKGPGQGGSRPWTERSLGRTSGRLSHTASPS